MKTSLSAAIGLVVPTNSTVEITLVRFDSNANTIVAPTLIDSPATLAAVQLAITNMTYPAGSTNTAAAITSLTNLVTTSTNFNTAGSQQIFNIMTDGNPNDQNAAVAAVNAAIAAGIDEIDLEAIGSGVNVPNLQALAHPGAGVVIAPGDPFVPGFVLPVSGFGAQLDDALQAKLRFVLDVDPVPEPASLTIFGMIAAGGAVYGWRRRRLAAAA